MHYYLSFQIGQSEFSSFQLNPVLTHYESLWKRMECFFLLERTDNVGVVDVSLAMRKGAVLLWLSLDTWVPLFLPSTGGSSGGTCLVTWHQLVLLIEQGPAMPLS